MKTYMRCNLCGKLVDYYDGDMYDEDLDECLWGHMQFEHQDEYDCCVDWETPDMLEEYYTKVRED